MTPRAIFLPKDLPAEAVSVLKENIPSGIKLFRLEADGKLAFPERAHPDMILSAADGTVVCDESYCEANEGLFSGVSALGITVRCEKTERGEEYPSNVSYNVLVTEAFIMCRTKSASPLLLRLCKNREVIDVGQGYAACSTLWDGIGAVTADPSVYNALTAYGIECLRIRQGYIKLDPYGYGFIGGASMRVGDTVFTFGSIETHPDGEEIKAFLTSHGKKIIPLFDGLLIDFGSAVVV